VLRFDGYFQEHVVEDPYENYRIRKCQILYYLTDGTIYVTEPKIENSGIPQGVFLKRQKIPRSLEDPYNFISWEVRNILFLYSLYRISILESTSTYTKGSLELSTVMNLLRYSLCSIFLNKLEILC